MTLRRESRPVIAFLIAAGFSAAIAAAETYTATAEVRAADGTKKTAPVTIQIDRFSTDAERQAALKTLKETGQAGLKKWLQSMKDLGWVEAASKKTPIRYAAWRSTGDGRVVTVVTPDAIVHLGADLPDAKPRGGYDLAIGVLILDAAGKGHGECAPAGKIKLQSNDAIAIEDYGGSTVWLQGIAKK
ncbi:MAG TPA: hypothetical protein VJA66_15485 [Thermoanaerobaculia bacterium]